MSDSLYKFFDWYLQIFPVIATLSLRAFIIVGIPKVWFHLSKWAHQRRILYDAFTVRSTFIELCHGCKIILFDSFIAVILYKASLFNFVPAQNFWHFVIGFIFMFVWFEIYFYSYHRLLHHPKLYWLHRVHHETSTVSPSSSIAFSLIERFILIFGILFVPVFISYFVPFPNEAYIGYLIINYILNVYGHLNVEFVPEKFVKSKFGDIFITPTYHAIHHEKFNGHYGLFTAVMDDLFGTNHKDYKLKHANNYSRGLSKPSVKAS